MGDAADDAARKAERELEERTADEAERLAREADPPPPELDPEVRADEFSRGTAPSVAASAFPGDVVEELQKPLDPNRIRRREGRGRGVAYEYLAGHDVKRTASEIFGFGNWGHRVLVQEEIAVVEVEREADEWEDGPDGRRKTGRKTTQQGFHVGYRCVVRIWVNAAGYVYETEGSGYGDGVEYTPAARVTACELALKEAETDALKRAFTDLGDQFGLVLYAKDDEKKRITRESNAGESRAVRVDQGPSVPRTWEEWQRRFVALLGGGDAAAETVGAFLRQAVVLRWGVPFEQLKSGERAEALQRAASALLLLEEGGDLAFHPDPRKAIQDAFAARWDGIEVEGPPFRLAATETDRPDREAPVV